jgi:plastocyanin
VGRDAGGESDPARARDVRDLEPRHDAARIRARARGGRLGRPDKVETRFLEPGESVRVRVDLREGVYKLECNVEGHDDIGMETLLRVKEGAPLARAARGPAKAQPNGSIDAVIEAFAFEPKRIEANVGQAVTWTNRDPAEHTVTEEGGGFDSGTMAANGSFTRKFDRPGEYRYICALHPGMTGMVAVRG